MNNGIKKIKWGIIGCGNVTEVKSGPGFQKADGSELIAVMRRDAILAEDYARRHNVPKWYDNADALINDADVDAVYVATPPNAHKEYTIKALRAGKPVYVEKPMALNYGECLEMIVESEKTSTPLFVAYYRRALPRFLKIKSLIDEGVIGQVNTVNINYCSKPSASDINREYNWRVDPAVAGAGYFFDLGSHMIDLLQYYFGKISSVSGHAKNIGGYYSAEDIVSAAFNFENGIKGAGNWNFCAIENIDSTEIIGSKGKIIFSTFSDAPIQIVNGKGIEKISIAHPEHVQQPLIQLVTNELLSNGKCPSTGQSGAHTSWVMDRILGRA